MDRRVCPHCGSSMKGWKLSEHVAEVHNLVLLQQEEPKPSSKFYEYTCNICNEGFNDVKVFVHHKHNKHFPSTNVEVHCCDWCTKQFTSITLYIEHIDKHYKEDDEAIMKEITARLQAEQEALALQKTIQDNYKEFIQKKLYKNG